MSGSSGFGIWVVRHRGSAGASPSRETSRVWGVPAQPGLRGGVWLRLIAGAGQSLAGTRDQPDSGRAACDVTMESRIMIFCQILREKPLVRLSISLTASRTTLSWVLRA